jgi:hypothetical protein
MGASGSPRGNYVPNGKLFPANIIAGCSKPYNEYKVDTWRAYVLEQTKEYEKATSVAL